MHSWKEEILSFKMVPCLQSSQQVFLKNKYFLCFLMVVFFFLLWTVADPGFPEGGALTSWGGTNSRGSYILKNLCVETKESGPVGGHVPGGAPPLDPPLVEKCFWVLFFFFPQNVFFFSCGSRVLQFNITISGFLRTSLINRH